MSHEPKPGQNSKPVCPHCSAEYQKWWDLDNDEDSTEIVECDNCMEWYEITCHVHITYSTQPV